MPINSISDAFISITPTARQRERQAAEAARERQAAEAAREREYWARSIAREERHKRQAALIAAEKAAHETWLAAHPDTPSLADQNREQQRADNARFAGRPVQFLSDVHGQYGTVMEAKRMCRPGSDKPYNFELRVRLSQTGRVSLDPANTPGMCVRVTLDDVKFID